MLSTITLWTSQSIRAVMSANATTTNPDYVCTFWDSTTSFGVTSNSNGALNGTTEVTLISAPASGTRVVKNVGIMNRDTVQNTITIRMVDWANTRILYQFVLQPWDTWDTGSIFTSSGFQKTGTGVAQNLVTALWSTNNSYRVLCGIGWFNAGNVTQTGSGTTAYNSNGFAKYWGATAYNGFIVPENLPWDYDSRNLSFNSWLTTYWIPIWSSNSLSPRYNYAQVNATGAVTAAIQRRYIMPMRFASGKTIGNFSFRNLLVDANNVTWFYEAGANTGLTGTMSIQCNFGKINTSGTTTQIGTSTSTYNLTWAANSAIFSCSDTTTASISATDTVYIEIIATVTQTARSSGASNILTWFATGSFRPIWSWVLDYCRLEFDII